MSENISERSEKTADISERSEKTENRCTRHIFALADDRGQRKGSGDLTEMEE